MKRVEHDPNASLDYQWDFGHADSQGRTWLAGDVIATATVTTDDASVTVSGVMHDDTRVTAWVSGGTAGKSAWLKCHITTVAGRQDDRTMMLAVTQR